jgi:cytochrome c
LAAYVTDPNKYVQEKTGDSSARTKMTFKLNKNQADIAAYLASASPAAQ